MGWILVRPFIYDFNFPFLIYKVSVYSLLTRNNDRRLQSDRRKGHELSIRLLLGNGKRRTIRRHEDRERILFVDHYSPWFFFAILAIILLSVTDGLLTLCLLDHGVSETNPVMAYFLEVGPFAFMVVKFSLTSSGVLILLILRNIILRKIKVKTQLLFCCVIGVFAAVVIFELYLIFKVVL